MDGTHVGGSLFMLPYAVQDLGLTTAQIFLHNPRAYLKRSPISAKDKKALGSLTRAGFPLIAHCTYPCVITNPEDDPKTLNALEGITEQLRNAAEVGARGLVLHPGSVKDQGAIQRAAINLINLEPVLSETGVTLLLENAASGLHGDPGVLADVIELTGISGLGICLDTAHAYGWGIDVGTPASIPPYLPERVTSLIGAVHFNNSMQPLGSKRDRHGALSDGLLSMEQLREKHGFLRRTLGADVPFIVEATQDPVEIAAMKSWTSESFQSTIVSEGV